MSTGLGRQSTSTNNYEVNVYGAVHNDGHRPLGGISNLLFTKDSNTQFTIKQNTTFTVYAEDTFTSPSTPVTGNNNYPNSTSITYYKPAVIFQNADVQITIGVTSGFSSSNGTYYIYCSGSDDTDASTRGNAVLAAETDAPAWSDQKLGWYHATHGKALGRYVVTSSVISEFMLYHGLCDRGYIQYAGIEFATTDNLIINRISCDIDGKKIEYLEDVNLEFNGQGAGWYIPYVDETTGGISFQAIASFSSGASGNQLDMLTTYDDEKKYCENGSKRGLGAVYFDGTTFDFIIPIDNRPKSYVKASSDTAQSISNAPSPLVVFDFEDVEIDVNSEITIGSSWNFTPKISGQFNYECEVAFASTAWTAGEIVFMSDYIDSAQKIVLYHNTCQSSSTFQFRMNGGRIVPLMKGQAYHIGVYQNSGAAINTLGNAFNQWIDIREV